MPVGPSCSSLRCARCRQIIFRALCPQPLQVGACKIARSLALLDRAAEDPRAPRMQRATPKPPSMNRARGFEDDIWRRRRKRTGSCKCRHGPGRAREPWAIRLESAASSALQSDIHPERASVNAMGNGVNTYASVRVAKPKAYGTAPEQPTTIFAVRVDRRREGSRSRSDSFRFDSFD